MFDWHRLSKNATDRVFDYFDVFTDGKYPKKFERFIKWYGYKFQPVLLSFSSTMLMFWIFFRVFGRIGYEKTMIILMILAIITIRDLKNRNI